MAQANLVPQLLAIMAQLAQQQFAAAGEGFPEHLASLTSAQQAVLAAASRLLHADSFSPSQSFEVGDQLAHTYSMPYAAQDISAGMRTATGGAFTNAAAAAAVLQACRPGWGTVARASD